MWPTRERPSSQLDKHGRSCMGKKRKEKKNSTPILMSKKLSRKEARSDLKKKKKKLKINLKRSKTEDSIISGLYCLFLVKVEKNRGWKSGERQRRRTVTRKRAQEIRESPTTNLFSLERNPTQPWTTLKASKTHFVFPVGRSPYVETSPAAL